MYTQRVPAYESLLTCKRDTELELHTPTGPVIQLLGVVQAPDAARVMAPIAASTGETRSVGQILLTCCTSAVSTPLPSGRAA